MTFEEHVENIKKELGIDSNLQIVCGEDGARDYIESIREKNPSHAKCLEDMYLKSKNTRGIYPWSVDEDLILIKSKNYIGTLAHEMRHVWQYKKAKDKFCWSEPCRNKFKEYLDKMIYLVSEKELDANEYARDYCKKNGIGEFNRYRCKAHINYICRALFRPWILLCFIWVVFVFLLF